MDRLEQAEALDPAVSRLGTLASKIGSGPSGAFWRGEWLGHALHPVLTDLPLGCWLSSALLDITTGAASKRESQRLVGLGLLCALPTAVSGLAEFDRTSTPESKRVALVHAAGNTAVLGLYAFSWRARYRGHHLRGVALGLLGGVTAIGTGYLGGHLSFTRGVGVRFRSHSRPGDSALAAQVSAVLDAGGTAVGEDDGQLLVEGPNTR